MASIPSLPDHRIPSITIIPPTTTNRGRDHMRYCVWSWGKFCCHEWMWSLPPENFLQSFLCCQLPRLCGAINPPEDFTRLLPTTCFPPVAFLPRPLLSPYRGFLLFSNFGCSGSTTSRRLVVV
jgi:hypothetical protein